MNYSAQENKNLQELIEHLLDEVTRLYTSDNVPWVIGYSGGKDSTAVLQIVWMALKRLAPAQLTKPVYVISTDTMVENPIVALWVDQSLTKMEQAALVQGLPIEPRRLTPELRDSFWVNLIGRGYPAPRPKFRWCTERLKIKPSNKFILDMVKANGEVILVLGTRKAESTSRAARMKKLEDKRLRERLSPNASLPNSLVYSPIEDWSNDDVWVFLMQYSNPWGYRNKDLLTMYQGASADGECPLVVDTTTPSCGSSRFGCWVCTLVDKDRSMEAMIQNDEEKEWMLPLLELRNALDMRDENNNRDDRSVRDFRRMSGQVELYSRGHIPGPYIQSAREEWLRRLLKAQRHIRENGPEVVRNIQLISRDELDEIRRIWVFDKHEIEDTLPRIYEENMEECYHGPRNLNDNHIFGFSEMLLLRESCEGDDLHFELLRELLDVEGQYRTMARRAGLFDALEKAFKRSAFESVHDATALAKKKREILEAAKNGNLEKFDELLLDVESNEKINVILNLDIMTQPEED
jgi:DNA sulfur modification protein DndC